MTTSAFVAGWAVAVILGLYAVHCFWEAGRAGLAAMSRGHGLQIAGIRTPLRPGATPAAYRARAWLALTAASALALGVLLLAH
jgi:4-hydroxybenzoate polyprenyltransferase